MKGIKVVKIKKDGSVKAKVNVDDIVSDGTFFYKIFKDGSIKKAVAIDLTLGELGKYLDIEIPDDISDVEVKVGKEFKSNNKLYKVESVKNKIVINIDDDDGNFDFIVRKIDNNHIIKFKV